MFENLIPSPHGGCILHLLYLLCHWHALAKLCIHTDDTLDILDGVTERLANQLRTFVAKTCPEFSTRELCCEAEACQQRETKEQLLKNSGPPMSGSPTAHANTRCHKILNLQTYKLHALGDYTTQIRLFGTTDSYSMQLVKRASHS